ncbi:MAG: hypothetical protein JSR72_23275 [Proteobacteria bacterium]|nr:hypothetical protein [Pseudomonadota bacterium]
MIDPTPPFVKEFNQTVEDVENFLVMTRASNLQRAALDVISAAAENVRAEKALAISNGDEDYANLLLGCQCVATALESEIKMWLYLKQERPDDAWNELVNAQMASTDAMRAHIGFSHLTQHVRRLNAIESLVFPPQVFVSSGMIVGFQECSICGGDYDECSHLVGKPYMGDLCHIVARNISLEHVAIVKDPADKRCRVERFSVEGGYRNRMTWQIEAESNEA